MRAISKSFSGIRALEDAHFDLRRGQVHALVGENGAGKSTLIKILTGVYPCTDYAGEIYLDGCRCRLHGVSHAQAAGISVIHQELSLVPPMTVAENIFLGREPRRMGIIHWNEIYRRVDALLRRIKLDIDPRAPIYALGLAQRQLVEIAKALSNEARILVLDEPTAALTEAEIDVLLAIIKDLRSQGVGIIYVSHKLKEVFAISDRVTILRDGRVVGTYATEALTEARLIAQMVGREVDQQFPKSSHTLGDAILQADEITVEDPSRSGKRLVDRVSFTVRRGEVLGIAGLMGAGRSELLMAIFGAYPRHATGSLWLKGQPVRLNDPCEAIRRGMGFVTEDRRRYGLILDQSVLHNLTFAWLKHSYGRFIIDRDAEVALAENALREWQIKAASVFVGAGTLSGGNQQKVVLARWLLNRPQVLLMDEPTRGIDVRAKQEIYAQINALAQSGLAIVLVSSDLPEVLGLSDRILVMHAGRLTGEFSRADATPETIMACATGERI
ncbi:MAG: ATP-binding cassette domain-containing protein [Acidobacteria bacterium]|nr:ATP-binding cassette domain-containing protein [Acidobacteriota bacterium]MBI3655879.1 ATP-binding cassette domain-containing protein [Acidobacteriota bacterium]